MKGLATIVLLAKTYQGLISWVCRHCGVPFDSQRCFFVERKFTPKTRGCNSAEIWTLRKTSTFNNPNQKWTCGSMFLGDIVFHLPSSEANFFAPETLGSVPRPHESLTRAWSTRIHLDRTWNPSPLELSDIASWLDVFGDDIFFFLKGLPNP